MKKLIVPAIVMMLMLSSCGGSESPADTAPTATPAPTATVTETPAPTPSPMETAQEFIDCEVEELIAAIGEPIDSDYVTSCLGPGKDGELHYEGFTVHTYKEGSSEIVRVVMES